MRPSAGASVKARSVRSPPSLLEWRVCIERGAQRDASRRRTAALRLRRHPPWPLSHLAPHTPRAICLPCPEGGGIGGGASDDGAPVESKVRSNPG